MKKLNLVLNESIKNTKGLEFSHLKAFENEENGDLIFSGVVKLKYNEYKANTDNLIKFTITKKDDLDTNIKIGFADLKWLFDDNLHECYDRTHDILEGLSSTIDMELLINENQTK